MIRGLIEKVPNPKDMRGFLYKSTFELLSHLGLTKIEDMPEYASARTEIESYKNSYKAEEASQKDTDPETEDSES